MKLKRWNWRDGTENRATTTQIKQQQFAMSKMQNKKQQNLSKRTTTTKTSKIEQQRREYAKSSETRNIEATTKQQNSNSNSITLKSSFKSHYLMIVQWIMMIAQWIGEIESKSLGICQIQQKERENQKKMVENEEKKLIDTYLYPTQI